MKYESPIETLLRAVPFDLRKLVHAGCSRIEKLDLAISFSNCLAGMAAGVVGVKQVLTPKGDTEPLALISFISAPPVHGKSKARQLFFKAHFEHEQVRLAEYEQTRKRDRKVRLREVVITDVDIRSLLSGLEGIGHTTTIYPLEGNSLLTSSFFRKKPETLCALWDLCEKVNLASGDGKRMVAMWTNVCVVISAQPEKFDEYWDECGQSVADGGLLQRVLPTLAPQCSMPEGFHLKDADMVLDAYYGKVEGFLKINYDMIQSGRVERDDMVLERNAVSEWFQMEEDFAQQAAKQSNPVMAQAYGRAIQHVTRIAGILHAYFGQTEDISADTLRAAWAIACWYLDQLADVMPVKQPKPIKLTTQQKQVQREIEDCAKILRTLNELTCLQRRNDPDRVGLSVSKLFVRCGIYRQRFNTAYERLKDERWITEIGKGNDIRVLAPQQLPTWAQPPPLAHL